MPALPLPDRIYTESTKEVQFSSISAKLGNGYSQRAAKGLNNVVDTFSISWPGLDLAEKEQVITVLRAVGNWDVLTWTPPAETINKKFIIPDGSGYSINYVGKRFNISTQLQQVFDL